MYRVAFQCACSFTRRLATRIAPRLAQRMTQHVLVAKGVALARLVRFATPRLVRLFSRFIQQRLAESHKG